MILAPIFAHIILAVTGTAAAIRTRATRRLTLPTVYLAFVAVAGIIGASALYAFPRWYRSTFWTLELAHNGLLALASLEIVSHLLPRRFVLAIGTVLLALLGAQAVNQIHKTGTADLLNLSLSAAFIALLFLVALVFPESVHWTRELQLATAGIAAVCLGDVVAGIKWVQGQPIAWLIPWATLPGLLVLVVLAAGWPGAGKARAVAA